MSRPRGQIDPPEMATAILSEARCSIPAVRRFGPAPSASRSEDQRTADFRLALDRAAEAEEALAAPAPAGR